VFGFFVSPLLYICGGALVTANIAFFVPGSGRSFHPHPVRPFVVWETASSSFSFFPVALSFHDRKFLVTHFAVLMDDPLLGGILAD